MIKLLITISILFYWGTSFPQGQIVELTSSMFDNNQQIKLAELDGWQPFKPTEITSQLQDSSGRVDCWLKLKFRLDDTFSNIELGISRGLWAATDVYIDGRHVQSFGNTGDPYEAYNPTLKYSTPVQLSVGEDHELSIHFVDYESVLTRRELKLKPGNLSELIQLTGPEYNRFIFDKTKESFALGGATVAISLILLFMNLLFLALNPTQKIFSQLSFLTTMVLLAACGSYLLYFYELGYDAEKIRFIVTNGIFLPVMNVMTLLILEQVILGRTSRLTKWIIALMPFASLLGHLFNISAPFGIINVTMLSYFAWLVITCRKQIVGAQWSVVVAMASMSLGAAVFVLFHKYAPDPFFENKLTAFVILSAPILILVYISVRYKEIILKVQQISEEKKVLLEQQNVLLERQVNQRTEELNASLENLKATQSQLVQSEKMASLGELTAGIAHEIQNPLNFVNNFSEVGKELLIEMRTELEKGNYEDAKTLADDVISNLEKINHHGKRADGIVKGMLQHSRTSSGQRELTDINTLADEYLRLSYHGLRAKDKTFNSRFETDFDPLVGKLHIVPQDIGRVILNLLTNAFHAVSEQKSKSDAGYEPTVSINTRKEQGLVMISVRDNGGGIPEKIKDKIFQPFFTTKPTGQGTGLGLSLSYDIVKAHGGKIEVESSPGLGTEFRITLPNT
jgi:signal transduction histidine kinase